MIDDPAPGALKADDPRPGAMFGGTIHRNMANPVEKNIPAEWSIQEGKQIAGPIDERCG